MPLFSNGWGVHPPTSIMIGEYAFSFVLLPFSVHFCTPFVRARVRELYVKISGRYPSCKRSKEAERTEQLCDMCV